MKIKLINFVTAFVIFFTLAAIIEFTVGWGLENAWFFIIIWAVCMALAEAFVLQPFRRRLKGKNKTSAKKNKK